MYTVLMIVCECTAVTFMQLSASRAMTAAHASQHHAKSAADRAGSCRSSSAGSPVPRPAIASVTAVSSAGRDEPWRVRRVAASTRWGCSLCYMGFRRGAPQRSSGRSRRKVLMSAARQWPLAAWHAAVATSTEGASCSRFLMADTSEESAPGW